MLKIESSIMMPVRTVKIPPFVDPGLVKRVAIASNAISKASVKLTLVEAPAKKTVKTARRRAAYKTGAKPAAAKKAVKKAAKAPVIVPMK
jgi:hypothetical protein